MKRSARWHEAHSTYSKVSILDVQKREKRFGRLPLILPRCCTQQAHHQYSSQSWQQTQVQTEDHVNKCCFVASSAGSVSSLRGILSAKQELLQEEAMKCLIVPFERHRLVSISSWQRNRFFHRAITHNLVALSWSPIRPALVVYRYAECLLMVKSELTLFGARAETSLLWDGNFEVQTFVLRSRRSTRARDPAAIIALDPVLRSLLSPAAPSSRPSKLSRVLP